MAIRTISPVLLLLSSTYITHGLVRQVDYNPHGNGEYCYTESYNLGRCLGKFQRESPYTDESLMNCLECQSVNISGNETCDEMKAMNNLLEGPLLEGQSTGENSTVNNSSSINWHDSYCEDYSKCIKSNCPRQCFHEQALFMDCVIIELD